MSRIIDVHVHLAPPEIVADRHRFLAGEGSWTDLYRDPKGKMVSTSDLLTMMDEEGVDQALVTGFPWATEDMAKRHNYWLLEEVAKHPDRLLALASFDVLAPWALGHAREMLTSGMFGLGELCLYDRGFGPSELEALQTLGELCRDLNKVFLMHVNEPIGHKYPGKAPLEIGHIYDLVRGCPGVRLILAHFGGGLPFFAALKKEVKEALQNIYFDTAAMPYLFAPAAIPMALQILDPHHFLLGTDYPLLKPSRYRKYFQEAGLSPEVIDMIMGLNAEKFLGLAKD